MIVTIDGPAGSGKSTISRILAEREGFLYLDTGAMYRTVGLACLRAGVDLGDADAVAEVAAGAHVDYLPGEDTEHVLLDGEDVTGELRTEAVDGAASAVAVVPAVREAMVTLQRHVAQGRDIICEGRDMGTVVFPDAEVKVYLDASPEERAQRRAVERAGGNTAQDRAFWPEIPETRLREVRAELKARDALDEGREVSPLVRAKDAVLVDTTNLSLDEAVAIIDLLIHNHRQGFQAMEDVDVPKEPGQESAQPSADAAADSKAPAETPVAPAKSDGAGAKPTGASDSVASVPEPTDGAEKKAERPAKESSGKRKSEHPVLNPKGKTPYDQRLAPMRPFHNTFDDYFEHGIMDWPWPSRALYDIIGSAVWLFTKALFPWKWEGEDEFFEWLETQDRGTVLIMNHVSFIETALPSVLYWTHGLRLRPIYKDELNKYAIGAWLLSRVGGIPVGRGTSDMKALRRAQHAIERGESVLVFPEGTRIQDDEKEAERFGGFALIAKMGKTTVTPSAVIGARRDVPGKSPFRHRHVFLKIGAPITFGMLGIKGRRAQLEAMEALAMERVYELRAQLRLEHPGEV